MRIVDENGQDRTGFIAAGTDHNADGHRLRFASIIQKWWGWTKSPAEDAALAIKERARMEGVEPRLYMTGEGLRLQREWLFRVVPGLTAMLCDGLAERATQLRDLGVTPEDFRGWVEERAHARDVETVRDANAEARRS